MKAQITQWSLNPENSAIEFKVKHLMISKVTGHFQKFEGQFTLDSENLAQSKASASIQVSSIDTQDGPRDRHLVGPDFFDAIQYPEIRFSSKKFVSLNRSEFTLYGDLTLHGVTREVILHCAGLKTIASTAESPAPLELTARTTLNRKDFGLEWNAAIEAGGLLVGDEIEIRLKLEFNRAR